MSTLAQVIIKDVFANRPSAGIAGRVFFSTDTNVVYRDNGTSWDNVAHGGAALYSSPPLLTGGPTGATTYTLSSAPANPTGSMYFVNGIKRQYGVYYSISGTTLTILHSPAPNTANGDSLHELYAS